MDPLGQSRPVTGLLYIYSYIQHNEDVPLEKSDAVQSGIEAVKVYHKYESSTLNIKPTTCRPIAELLEVSSQKTEGNVYQQGTAGRNSKLN